MNAPSALRTCPHSLMSHATPGRRGILRRIGRSSKVSASHLRFCEGLTERSSSNNSRLDVIVRPSQEVRCSRQDTGVALRCSVKVLARGAS